MASYDISGPAGRPSGMGPKTLAKARRFLELNTKYGVPVKRIANSSGLSPSWIWKMLKEARVAAEQDALASTAADIRSAQESARLSEGALTNRALLALRRDPRFRTVNPANKLLWLECVLEIHALGGENGLPFGGDGDPFERHADFAAALGGSAYALEALLRRGLLARLENGGIDLPAKLGLKPREKERRAPSFVGGQR